MIKSKNIFLGLDISSKSTGYAVVSNGKWKRAEKYFGLITPPEKILPGEKLTYFRKELIKVILKTTPTHIFIEDVFGGRNITTTKTLSRFAGVAIQSCFEIYGVEPTIINTSTVRSFLKSGQKKEEAFSFIVSKYKLDWGFNTHNDITDAIMLALYGYKITK